ncbi:hypothetical protein LSAT2_001286 [Lamellibrachia satsuma]|nr:hypothetical protein LSAT2_001286 [Lamellibrachia satsuma]
MPGIGPQVFIQEAADDIVPGAGLPYEERLDLDDLFDSGNEKDIECKQDKEVEQCLSSTEVQLCQIMKRVEFRRKFGLRVALLLTPNMLDNIWTMLDVRGVVGVREVVVPDDTDCDSNLDDAPNERIHREQNGIVNVGKCCI